LVSKGFNGKSLHPSTIAPHLQCSCRCWCSPKAPHLAAR